MQWGVFLNQRWWHIRQNGFKERAEVGRVNCIFWGQGRFAFFCNCVNYGEIKLLGVGCQFQKEVLGHTEDHFRAGGRPVYFVDNHNRFEAHFKSFSEDEPGLGHWAVHRVNQQQAAIGHVQDALDLAAKVGVTGGVNNINFGALINNGCIFSQDGNTFFTFEVIRIHNKGANRFIFAENIALFEQAVHQGGFAVVNVSYDSDISNIVAGNMWHLKNSLTAGTNSHRPFLDKQLAA